MAYPSNEPDEEGPPAAEELVSIVERIESIEAEMAEKQLDRKLAYGEAKELGFDTRALKKLIALRKRNPDDVAEEAATLELYQKALSG